MLYNYEFRVWGNASLDSSLECTVIKCWRCMFKVFDFFNYFISWLDVFSVWLVFLLEMSELGHHYHCSTWERENNGILNAMLNQWSSKGHQSHRLFKLWLSSPKLFFATPIAFVFLWVCYISLISNILIRIPPVGRMALLQSNSFAELTAMMNHLVLSLARLSSFSRPYRISLAA